MREIKFRAWDGERMKSPVLPHDAQMALNGYLSALAAEGTIFMQFTGLKDKNGVEIYEGDIVLSDLHTDPKKTYLVQWSEANQGFRPVMFHDATEVLGNIYENPELMK